MIRKISLGLSLLVIVFFFLPWVSVTCAGQEVMTVTGLEMVTGFDYETPQQAGRASPEILAIVILAIALLGAGAYFLRGKGGSVSRGILATLGIIFLLVLKFKIDGDIRKEGEGIFQASYLLGFWLTFISFLAAAATNFLHFKGKPALSETQPYEHAQGPSPPEIPKVETESTDAQPVAERAATSTPPSTGTRPSDRMIKPAPGVDELMLGRNRLIAVAIGLIILAIFSGVAFRLPGASTHIAGNLFVGGVIKLAVSGIMLLLVIPARYRLATVLTYYARQVFKVNQPSRAKVATNIDGLSSELANIVIIAIVWSITAQVVDLLLLLDVDRDFSWVSILVTLGFVALLLYRLYRGYGLLTPVLAAMGKAPQELSCPKCGTVNRASAQFCSSCGAELKPTSAETTRPASALCSECGAENSTSAKFCQSCGAPLSATEQH